MGIVDAEPFGAVTESMVRFCAAGVVVSADTVTVVLPTGGSADAMVAAPTGGPDGGCTLGWDAKAWRCTLVRYWDCECCGLAQAVSAMNCSSAPALERLAEGMAAVATGGAVEKRGIWLAVSLARRRRDE